MIHEQTAPIKITFGIGNDRLSPFGECHAIDIVKDGQANAPGPVKAVATDFQKHLAKISGVKLPLTSDGKDVPDITLNMGKTASTQTSDLPDAKLNPETYAITQRDDDVYFEGHHPSPTAFAVYSFLQDQLV